MRRALLLGLPLVLVLGGACTARLWTRFPHQKHLGTSDCGGPGQQECLRCTSCHQVESALATEWHTPPESKCQECHRAQEKFHYAESLRAPASPKPAGLSILFNHARHLQLPDIKGQCIKCHQGAVGTVEGKTLFPPMATCLGCHEHENEFAQNSCERCHRPADLRALKPVTFLAHTDGWMRRHAAFARESAAACVTCHAQAQCDSCHDATQGLRVELRAPEALDSTQVHRFDFLSRHSIEARSQPALCVSCHQRQDCDACHVRRGVSGGAADGRNPHPPGWAIGTGEATNQHGRAARRDIASCAACHDQGPATNCVRCHKVGGFGGNPHGPGWRSSQPTSAPACAVCHRSAL